MNTFSVPVNHEQPFIFRLDGPAPAGGVTYELHALDPSIVAAGNRNQSVFPQVTVPAGQIRSNPFTLYGIKVGQTRLNGRSLTPGFLSFSAPATSWQVGNPTQSAFLDVNAPGRHCRQSDTSALIGDEAVLATCGSNVQGAVTDGLSQLLMRVAAGLPGTVCFEVHTGAPPDPGTVAPAVTAVSYPHQGLYQGFGFYTPPDGFDGPLGWHQVEVDVLYTPSVGQANTTGLRFNMFLVRPPVVLVHGLWSSDNTWESSYERKGYGFTTVKANYGKTNASPFAANQTAVPKAIEQALDESRKNYYATTQVDLVAHSMGALLSRLYIQDPANRRPDNFNQGDVHRLVTLTAPHYGSSLANLIVALSQCCRQDLPDVMTGIPGSISQGAICDLAENSPALQALAATPLPTHVVVATGGPGPGTYTDSGDPDLARYWNGVLNLEQRLTKLRVGFTDRGDPTGYVFPPALVNGYRFRQRNDAIVALSSQLGGVNLASPVKTEFPTLLHAYLPGEGSSTGVTGASEVAAAVWSVLDASAPSPVLGSGLGAVPSDGSGVAWTVAGHPGAAAAYQSECAPGGALNPGPLRLAAQAEEESFDPRIRILSPQSGQEFSPGESVPITVSVDPTLRPPCG